MAHIRSIATCILDDPRREGTIIDGRFGALYDFPFLDEEGREDLPRDSWDLSDTAAWGAQIVKDLRCLTLRGLPRWRDLTLGGEWLLSNSGGYPNCSNLWRVEGVQAPDGKYYDHIFFTDGRGAYDASTAYYGEVTQNVSGGWWYPQEPNFVLTGWRYPPPPNLPVGGYSFIELLLLSMDPAGGPEWALSLPGPGGTRQYMKPRLSWRANRTSTWECVKELGGALREPTKGQKPEPAWFGVTWETFENHVILTLGGAGTGNPEVIYIPKWQRHSDTVTVGESFLRLTAYGAMAKVVTAPLVFPSTASAAQRDLLDMATEPTNLIDTSAPAGHYLGWEPPGTAVGVFFPEESTDKFRVRVDLTTDNPLRRPACYLAQVDFPPGALEAQGATWESDGRNVVVLASGSVTDDWRNATCQVEIECEKSYVGELPALKGNNFLQVTAGHDDGATTDTCVHFTGRTVGSTHTRAGEKPERVCVGLRARDGFFSLERKRWKWLGCFEGWDLADAFERALTQWGIPASRITFTGDANLKVPTSDRPGTRRFDFAGGSEGIGNLNQLVAACDYTWGVDQTGQWFCRPPTEYVSGCDFTINADTAAAEEMVFKIVSEFVPDQLADGKPFANYLLFQMLIGGELQEVFLRDDDSHHDSAATNFVGEDWWGELAEQYAEALDATTVAPLLRRSRGLRHTSCTLEMVGKPNWWPLHFIRVQAAALNLPAGATDSVFQIAKKDWTADGRYRTTFETRYVGPYVAP